MQNTILDLVAQWLELDEQIRVRLESPRGWSADQIAAHTHDLARRNAIKQELRVIVKAGM